MAIVFAATYPARSSALVLFNATACGLRRDDYPIGVPPEIFERFGIGSSPAEPSEAMQRVLYPSLADDEAFKRAHRERSLQATSPSVARALLATTWRDDARQALSAIQAPTLVVHRRGDRAMRLAHGRYLADHIPGARLVELDGEDHVWFAGDTDAFIDEIQEFLTGVRPIAESDRVLATVMFTDFVDSTAKAAAAGDTRWKSVLDEHDALVRRQLERFRGRYVNTTGDGVLATFDGPARGVRCAQAICDGVRALGLEVRAGLHTGEVELRGEDIGGIAVHIGQRVSALAGPGEVLVSRTVTDLVAGSGLEFEERGEHELKGVPGKWTIYAVKQ
jgi:class 3 adenylate cyclase